MPKNLKGEDITQEQFDALPAAERLNPRPDLRNLHINRNKKVILNRQF